MQEIVWRVRLHDLNQSRTKVSLKLKCFLLEEYLLLTVIHTKRLCRRILKVKLLGDTLKLKTVILTKCLEWMRISCIWENKIISIHILMHVKLDWSILLSRIKNCMFESTLKRVYIQVEIFVNLTNKIDKYNLDYQNLNFLVNLIYPAVLPESQLRIWQGNLNSIKINLMCKLKPLI